MGFEGRELEAVYGGGITADSWTKRRSWWRGGKGHKWGLRVEEGLGFVF